MATALMDMEQKIAFSRLFIRVGALLTRKDLSQMGADSLQHYAAMMRVYVRDDHDHAHSVAAMSVQILTVPTIARVMVAEEDALAAILRFLLLHFKGLISADNVFAFGAPSFTFDHKRAIVVAHDAKSSAPFASSRSPSCSEGLPRYLVSAPPPAEGSEEWGDGKLLAGFHNGFATLLAFLDNIQVPCSPPAKRPVSKRPPQGMDATSRHTGAHIEFEPEWESAFNIQLRLQGFFSSLLR